MAASSNIVCNYKGEIIRFPLTAKSKFSLSLMLFLLTLPIHSLPPSDKPTHLLGYHCSGNNNNNNITNGSVLQRNLNVVLNSLVDNVNKTGYSESIYGQNRDEIYGDAQCRGDLNASACRGCVSKAIEHLDLCNGSLSYASILLSGCILRYAIHNYYSKSNVSDASQAIFAFCGDITINGTDARGVKDWKIASLLERLIEKAVSSKVGYNTQSDYGVYSLAQCLRALSMSECNECLNNMYNYLGSCPAGTSHGLACFDNCAMCYAGYKFYGDGVPLFSAPRASGSGPSIRASRATEETSYQTWDSNELLPDFDRRNPPEKLSKSRVIDCCDNDSYFRKTSPKDVGIEHWWCGWCGGVGCAGYILETETYQFQQ